MPPKTGPLTVAAHRLRRHVECALSVQRDGCVGGDILVMHLVAHSGGALSFAGLRCPAQGLQLS